MVASDVPERLVPGTADWDRYYDEHRQRYDFALPRVTGMSVLDAACGVGYGTAILSQEASSVLGVDISREAIARANRDFLRPNVTFECTDVLSLPVDDSSFDVAVSFETIEHVTDAERFIQEVRRVLKPGGLFICSTPNKRLARRKTNPHHLGEMTYEEFAALLGKYFTIEESYHQSHSAAFRRHVDLVHEVRRLTAPVRSSKCLELENRIRRVLGRTVWDLEPLSDQLGEPGVGDFVIEPMTEPSDRQVTYIVVSRARE